MEKMPPYHIAPLSLPERLDVKSVEALRPWLEKPWTQKLGAIGNLGAEKPLLLLSALVLTAGLASGNPRLRRAGLRMGIAHVVAMRGKEFGKNHVDRSRPAEQLEDGGYHMAQGTSHNAALRSFPSGHTAGAFALARAFAREYPRQTLPVMAAATIIGVLQLPRRAHYPGDILAGVVLGLSAEKTADGVMRGLSRFRRRR